jgi:hypothetical protein
MNGELRQKHTALEKAPNGPCGSPAPSSLAPDASAPPPALPVRPVYDVIDATSPPSFCSEAERRQFVIDSIDPMYVKSAENAERAAEFRTAVERAVNAQVQADRPISPELTELRRQAADDFRKQENLARFMEDFRAQALKTPIVDCRAPEDKTAGALPQTTRQPSIALPADYGVNDKLSGIPKPGDGLPFPWRKSRAFGLGGDLILGIPEVPPISAGVVRPDAGDEKAAGHGADQLNTYGIRATLNFPAGPFGAFVDGSYSEASSKTASFAVEPDSTAGVGFAFGRETDGSTGIVLGSFAGETGSIRTDLDDFSIRGGIQIPLTPGDEGGIGVFVAPFFQYEHRNTQYDSQVTITGSTPEFPFDIGQERHQQVAEDHWNPGVALSLDWFAGRGVYVGIGGTAGIDFLHSSLDSVERNRCDVCSGELEDFTLETHQTDNTVRFRGGLDATLGISLSDNVRLTVGGSLDFVPTRGVENPVTGDDVLDGKTTRLAPAYDALSRYFYAGATIDF